MGAGFQALAAAGAQNAQNEAAIRQQQQQQQRAQAAALYWNAVQTELPPSTVKDAQGNQVKNPAYDEALQKRENALKSYISYLGPEQHATIGNRIHGLIFGPEHQEMQQNATPPVSSQAPAPPGTAPVPTTAATPAHPFAHNPVYAGILKGLEGLGSHLKAAANPLPPQPQPDYKMLAEVPTEEQRKALEEKKMLELRNQGQLAAAKARTKLPTEPQRFLDSYAVKINKPIDDWTPEDFEAANKEYKASVVAGVRPSQAALATYIRARFGDNPTADQIAQATREHQQMMAGLTVGSHQMVTFDDYGKPHVITLHSESGKDFGVPKTPVSSQAPSLSAVNAKIAAANSVSKRLNKKKSSQAPDDLNFTKGNPMVKSDAAQYTKVAEDANNKQEAYDSARKALASGSTASSDQELIYSWVRANVQGAGRMTQAEFRQAASIGSLPQRAQIAWQRTLTGKLPPEMEQMFLADIKRASETSQQEADTLRQRLQGGPPISSQAPQVPTSTPAPPVDQNLLNKLNSALSGGG